MKLIDSKPNLKTLEPNYINCKWMKAWLDTISFNHFLFLWLQQTKKILISIYKCVYTIIYIFLTSSLYVPYIFLIWYIAYLKQMIMSWNHNNSNKWIQNLQCYHCYFIVFFSYRVTIIAAVHKVSVLKDHACCNTWKFGIYILNRSGYDYFLRDSPR